MEEGNFEPEDQLDPRERYKRRHKALGLCVECGEKVYRNHVRCYLCFMKHDASDKRYYRRNQEVKKIKVYKYMDQWKQNYRCVHCGAPLQEEDLNEKTGLFFCACVSCRYRR